MKKNNVKNIKKLIKNVVKSKSFKILSILLVFVIVVIVVVYLIIIESKKQKYELYTGENLSESKYPGYKELIDNLQQEHPNWSFTLFYTKLDWEEVIENEGHSDNRKTPRNLISEYYDYPDDWKCEIDIDNRFDNGTWLCASDKAIKYQMDPRNVLTEENIFEFLELKYTEGAYTAEGIEYLTDNTFLEGDSITEALLEASESANVDAYFVVSRLIQEQGRNGSTMSKGYEYNGTIVYNVFNINASGDSTEEILENAAKYAYEKGWDTLEKSLIGGVEFVKKGYINVGQNTLYFQKFDVVSLIDDTLYTNQYMQNLMAPKSEARNMMSIYETSDTVNSELNFIVPLYENMPEEVSEY